jgi:hypothetical protein
MYLQPYLGKDRLSSCFHIILGKSKAYVWYYIRA